ncbi:MAG: hypothetical protein V4472_25555 [Pseudomonadota bacterium]
MSDPSEPAVTVRLIPETVIEGQRLGRHVRHDPRSLAYPVAEGTPVTVRWNRDTPVLDQGATSSCTGNAAVGVLGSDPFYADLADQIAAGLSLDEAEALTIYSAAEKIDGGVGYPPEDEGSSGLSVAQAAKTAGLISGYQHVLSVAAAHTAVQAGPFIVGSDWYSAFDTPDPNGLVAIGGTVRGGHEYECVGYAAATDLWELVNSWGPGWGVAGHFFYSSATFAALLAAQGDATVFVPVSQPAPVPTPPSPPAPGPTPDPTPDHPGFLQRIEDEVEHVVDDIEGFIHHTPPESDPDATDAPEGDSGPGDADVASEPSSPQDDEIGVDAGAVDDDTKPVEPISAVVAAPAHPTDLSSQPGVDPQTVGRGLPTEEGTS